MNEQTKAFTSDKKRDVITHELLLAPANIGATILVGAMGEPKVPPYSGD